MTDSEREAEFNNRHLLTSNKLSAHVTFSIDMSVSKLSKDVRLAPIYEVYEKFMKQRDKERNIKFELINGCKQNIGKYGNQYKDSSVRKKDFRMQRKAETTKL